MVTHQDSTQNVLFHRYSSAMGSAQFMAQVVVATCTTSWKGLSNGYMQLEAETVS